MEHLTLTPDTLTKAADTAAAILRRGGVVLYPTETLYGLGADARSNEAVDRLYAIKGRAPGKPIHALVADEAMASTFGVLDANAKVLLSRIHEPLSLVVPKREGAAGGILRSIDTFGFRVARHPFCTALVQAFGAPVTTTSANKAGRLPERSVGAIVAQLGDTASLIDLVIDAGELPESQPSTIVDLSMNPALDEGPVILREGTVPAADIWNALRG